MTLFVFDDSIVRTLFDIIDLSQVSLFLVWVFSLFSTGRLFIADRKELESFFGLGIGAFLWHVALFLDSSTIDVPFIKLSFCWSLKEALVGLPGCLSYKSAVLV